MPSPGELARTLRAVSQAIPRSLPKRRRKGHAHAFGGHAHALRVRLDPPGMSVASRAACRCASGATYREISGFAPPRCYVQYVGGTSNGMPLHASRSEDVCLALTCAIA